MHSKIAMSPFASMLPHLCENDNNFEIKLRIGGATKLVMLRKKGKYSGRYLRGVDDVTQIKADIIAR